MNVLGPCLPELDILFMNEDEAAQIGAGQSIAALARTIAKEGTRTVVMKRSRKGCCVYASDQEIICPAYEVEARDTTGAGDCFVAGFLAAHLEGALPERAGLMGNAAGALSIQTIGAVEGLLPRQEFEEWMARTPLRCREPRSL
jgi:sugar/nucleoside kinase (ribokinase family)